MMSISRHIGKLLVLCAIIVLCTGATDAQEPSTQTLTVSPTLFEMSATPGQAWTSELRVINVNNYDLTVYPEPVNFKPVGEDGRGNLLPIDRNETSGGTLAEWIIVPAEPVTIRAGQTATIPLQINVPDDAAPGGHYAAVLIGTRPPTNDTTASRVQTAQFVTSLFFVRVAGDVRETGNIREFTTTPSVVQAPATTLLLRFENTGNVHLQPQGNILIYNMWGEKRGEIPINHQTHFGNVLPASVRQFSFSWEGNISIFDIGRYKAVATLGYGDDAKQFVTSTTYFWVVPYTTILLTLIGLYLALRAIMWLIRRHIEQTLARSGVYSTQAPYQPARLNTTDNKTVIIKPAIAHNLAAPIRHQLAATKRAWQGSGDWVERVLVLWRALRSQYLLLAAIAIAVILVVLIAIFYQTVKRSDTHYNIALESNDQNVLLSSEELAYREAKLNVVLPPEPISSTPVTVVNSSGRVGAGATARLALEQAGYRVDALSTDTTRDDLRTIVIYHPEYSNEALAISKLLKNAILSARATDSDDRSITVFAGKDLLID